MANPITTSSSVPRTGRLRRAALAAAAGGAFLLAALQCLPAPPLRNPPVSRRRTIEASMRVPQHVSALLRRACADCHSNQTRWPWYSRVAPFSWLVARDVNQARRAMNFSEWPSGSDASNARAIGMLAASCAAVEGDLMPPRNYLRIHPEAHLSPVERQALCEWTQTEMSVFAARNRESGGEAAQ